MNYTYDAQAAHDADTGAGNKYLSETGAYVGKIVKVTGKKTSKGGDSINIAFESEDGRKADYLTLQICSATGEKYYGHGVFMAVMRCSGVKVAESRPLSGGKPGDVDFPGFEGKPLGVVVQATEYMKPVKDQDGRKTGETLATRLELVAAFHPKTRQMSIELDKNASAAALDRMLATLTPVRPLKVKAGAPVAAAATAGAADPNDDVPW